MGKRKENRAEVKLPIKMLGTESNGKPFICELKTLEISHSGVRVAGFNGKLFPDDIVSIQHGPIKARFRVVWVGTAHQGREKQLGLENLDPHRGIFDTHLKDSGEPYVDGYFALQVSSRPGEERRVHTRYATPTLVAELSRENSDAHSWVRVIDVSSGGCYLETPAPSPVGSTLTLRLKAEEGDICTEAVVRACHPSMGMGLEFTTMAPEAGPRLESYLKRLGTGAEPVGWQQQQRAREVTAKLEETANQLRVLDELIRGAAVDPVLLAHFRTSLNNLRNTAWAVQQTVQLQAARNEPFVLMNFINDERIRIAIEVCTALSAESKAARLEIQPRQLEQLRSTLERLLKQVKAHPLAAAATPDS